MGKGREITGGILCVLCEPDGGEVAPAEFANDGVATI
jgi:hypothetical protein